MGKRTILFFVFVVLIIGAKWYHATLYYPIAELLYPVVGNALFDNSGSISMGKGIVLLTIGLSIMQIFCWLPYIIFCAVIILLFMILWRKKRKT